MRLTGDQEVAGSTPAGLVTLFREDLIMKYFLVILCLRLIQEGQLQFLAKECAQYWLNHLEN